MQIRHARRLEKILALLTQDILYRIYLCYFNQKWQEKAFFLPACGLFECLKNFSGPYRRYNPMNQMRCNTKAAFPPQYRAACT